MTTIQSRVLAFAAIVVIAVSLALIAVRLVDRAEARRRVPTATNVTSQASAESVEPRSSSPSPKPGSPPTDAATLGTDPPRIDGKHRPPQEVHDGVRNSGHEASPPPPTESPTYTQSREPDARPKSVPASRHAPSPAAATPSETHGAAVALPKPESPAPSAPPSPTPPAESDPGASDPTPPVLQRLRFDPPVVEGGSVTTLTIEARDDLSGVKSFRGEVRSPNRSATVPFWSQIPPGDATTFSFALTIPQGAESGIWYVSWISITDGADNVLLLQAPDASSAPAGGTFTVSSAESDSVAPEIRDVWFDKPAVDGGDKNAIWVDVHDEGSGVASIMGACQSPSKSALIWFTGALNAETGMWGGAIPVPKNAECGTWGIQQISAKDRAGNTNLLGADSPIVARAGFQVSYRAECDSVAPTLDAFELSPVTVPSATGAEILVTATVFDAGSGAAQMTGWFLGPVEAGGQPPKISFQCSPNTDDAGAPWTCKVVVPPRAAKGTWRVGVIRLEDKAHNSREYTVADPVVVNRDFEVQ